MSEKKIVGIDFGTSTSVVRVKSYNVYKNNESETWRSFDRNELMTYNVTFNSGQVIVPTIVQKVNNANANNITYFGYDAAIHKKGETLYQNFKVDLEGVQKESARALTQEYIGYLYEQYREQREGGYLGDPTADDKTIISYPVKWSEETRNFMVEAAKKAGFKDVEGMDEAEAAITAVIAMSRDMLNQKGYIADGTPANIMLIDMGAGTTDIVICRYTPGDKPKNEILCTWPNEGEILFGGRELDEILNRYILDKTPEDGKSIIKKKISLNEYKAWKENTVSGCLQRNESVTYFSHASTLLDVMDMDLEEFSLDRAVFEDYAREYLDQFPQLINGSIQACVNSEKLSGSSDIDLVVLTGGHSSWYFVREMLLGVGDKISIEKIREDNNRLISIAKPQETVALGLVYSKLPMKFEPVKIKSADSQAQTQADSQTKPQAKPNADTNNVNEDKGEYCGTIIPSADPSDNEAGDLEYCPHCKEPFETPYQIFCHNCGSKRNFGLGSATPEGSKSDNPIFNKVTVSLKPRQDEQAEFADIVTETFSLHANAEPTNSMNALRREFEIRNDIEVYCTHDTSWFKRGKNGIAFCSNGIYVHDAFQPGSLMISWAEYLLCKNDVIMEKIRRRNSLVGSAINDLFHGILKNKLMVTAFYKRLIRELPLQKKKSLITYPQIIGDISMQTLSTILYIISSTDELREIFMSDRKRVEETENWLKINYNFDTEELYSDFVKQIDKFKSECLNGIYTEWGDYTTTDKGRDIIKAIYYVPDDEQIFFARGSEHDGIVIAQSGIYSCLDDTVFSITWDKFLLVDLIIEEGKIKCDGLTVAKKIHGNTSMKFNNLEPFVIFQEQLRETDYYKYLKEQAANSSNHLTSLTDEERCAYYMMCGVSHEAREFVDREIQYHVYGLNDMNEEIRNIYFGLAEPDEA